MTETEWRRPETVLITGGTGFTGVYVSRLLIKNGQRPIAAGIGPCPPEGAFVLGELAKQVTFEDCDLRDAVAVEALVRNHKVDAIIHAGGFVGVDHSLRDPAQTYAVNTGGTVNLLEAARKHGVGKVVIVSSNAAYQKKERPAFDETHPITSISAGNPNAHYGTTKMIGEQIGLAYYTFHGIDVLAARITAVYGTGMRAAMFIKPLVESAVRGEHLAITTGAAVARDYTYIEDAAAGIVAMLNTDTRKLEQRIFNLSRGELVNAGEVAALVRDYIPGADVSIGEALSPLEAVNVDQRAPLASEAARKAFGFTADTDIKKGVRLYIDSYREFLKTARQ